MMNIKITKKMIIIAILYSNKFNHELSKSTKGKITVECE